MVAYALAHVRSVEFCPDIVEYLEKIDATMDPFGGRFVFHGGEKDVVEGAWPGDVILIEFPDLDAVRAWWESDAYQEIKHLRTDHMEADIVLFESLPMGHRATDSLKKLLAS
ncbi:DUF1330 domain-containing protein [Catenulispora subtropica]|uniref:DUF1330 domain-containing protein n=1 Tax=Catenulispora subtropica TaxID=450798 RepID=A0ABN2QFQ9_9ACTN